MSTDELYRADRDEWNLIMAESRAPRARVLSGTSLLIQFPAHVFKRLLHRDMIGRRVGPYFCKQGDQFWIAPAALRFLQHDLERVGMRKSRLIGPGSSQSVIDVGYLQNACEQRD